MTELDAAPPEDRSTEAPTDAPDAQPEAATSDGWAPSSDGDGVATIATDEKAPTLADPVPDVSDPAPDGSEAPAAREAVAPSSDEDTTDPAETEEEADADAATAADEPA